MKLNIQTVRLAGSYLAIIMVLSVSFSVIFYQTSTAELGMRLTSMNEPNKDGGQSEPLHTSIVGSGSEAKVTTSTDIEVLNAELQKSIANLHTDLRNRLIILNISAFVIGGLISVFLARKTLRPIEAAIESQARFSSDASHELRTPLTALRLRNEVALRSPSLTLKQARRVMENSVDQALRLEKLSDGLLRLSREDGKPIKRTSFLLEDAANEAMNHVIDTAQAKHISIEERVPPLPVGADKQGVMQAIVILLDNAIKYSEEKGRVYLEGKVEGRYAVLCVRDTGVGIRASDLPHIFERFYRAESSRVRHGEAGYGLGLSIAKKIIEQNGGKLSVESQLGEGSTFIIKLPIDKL